MGAAKQDAKKAPMNLSARMGALFVVFRSPIAGREKAQTDRGSTKTGKDLARLDLLGF
jgi:hypothetical protein